MAELQISNVVNISVSEVPAGLDAFNTSNLALFTSEVPDPDFDLGYKIYKEPTEVGTDFGTDSTTYAMALSVFSQAPNILAADGNFVVILLEPSETLAAAITRTATVVQYFGILTDSLLIEADVLAAAAVVQALSTWKILFVGSKLSAAVQSGGTLDKLRTGSLTKSRGLLYIGDADNSDGSQTLGMIAAYAGRALSVNFSGSNTTQTMNLKDLATIQPDPGMNQTIYNAALIAGADVYASIQGVPKVLTSGANKFFDQVYNLGWFVGALQVAGFNYLAQTSTKVVQTENGMDGLKGAYREVCKQAITNQYFAPGVWNSPVTFGNQEDLLANISQQGYYIYSTPIANQLQVDREGRVAPLVQIAGKEAGAIQKSNVQVNVNA